MFEREWQRQAFELYFEKHMKINCIAASIGKTRQTVSSFLRLQPEWSREQELRKAESAKRRKEQKAFWEKLHRSEPNLKREHETAVRILSAEKYH